MSFIFPFANISASQNTNDLFIDNIVIKLNKEIEVKTIQKPLLAYSSNPYDLLYLIWIVGFFSVRIIYLLKSRNTTFDKKDGEGFLNLNISFMNIIWESSSACQFDLPNIFFLSTESFFALNTSR